MNHQALGASLVCVMLATACGPRQPVAPAVPLTPMEQCRADVQAKRDSCAGCWWWWAGGPWLGLIAGSICTGGCQQAADNMAMICNIAALASENAYNRP